MIEQFPYILDYGISPSCPNPFKKCRYCGETKPLGEFVKDKTCRDGHSWRCLECFHIKRNSNRKSRSYAYPEEINITEGMRRCRGTCGKIKPLSEFVKRKLAKDGYRRKCLECNGTDEKARYQSRPEKKKTRDQTDRKSINQTYYRAHLEEITARRKAHARNPKNKERTNKRQRERRNTDPKFRLNGNMSRAIRLSLKGKKNGKPWEDLLGYSLGALEKHLQRQFTPGMTMDNQGEWHIDHIVPVSAFNFEKAEDIDFKRCWALDNLRPMWAMHNLKKGNKIDKPFQPSLIF